MSQTPDPLPDDPKRAPAGGYRALDRARADLERGRPDLARNRITGLLYTLHGQAVYCEAAYRLLGAVCWEMKDLPAAGAAWLLTTHEGPQVEAAVAAFHQRFGRDGAAVLHALKPRAPGECFPAPVQARLREWGYRYRPYRPRDAPPPATEVEPQTQPSGVRPVEAGCLAVLALSLLLLLSYLLRLFGIL